MIDDGDMGYWCERERERERETKITKDSVPVLCSTNKPHTVLGLPTPSLSLSLSLTSI